MRQSHPGARRRIAAAPGPMLVAALLATALAGCGRHDDAKPGAAPVGTAAAPAPAPVAPAGTTAANPANPAKPVTTKPADARTIAARSHVPVLCYHQIRDWRPGDSATAKPLIVPPKAFDAQMTALARAGYTTISGRQLVAHLATGAALPPKPVLVTFDDGSEGQYTNAVPILRRHHFTATFFTMTVVLGKPRWLKADELRAMDRMGFEIAPHTYDHPPMSKVTDAAGFRTQLVEPRAELAGIVGHPVDLFAYPYGVWNARTLPQVRKAGYAAAFQLNAKPLDPTWPLLTIRREMVPPGWDGMALLGHVAKDF